MEKNTVLAIVLSVAVMLGFFVIQGIVFPPKPLTPTTPPVTENAAPVTPVSSGETPAQPPAVLQDAPVAGVTPAAALPENSALAAEPAEKESYDAPQAMPQIIIETNLIKAVFSNAGGDMISYQLMNLDNEPPLEMILGGSSEPHAFTVSFGNSNDLQNQRIKPLSEYFHVERSSLWVEFSRNYSMIDDGSVFTLTKRYNFKPDEYMFELTISLNGNSVKNYDFNRAAYTLAFGPQIGPQFQKLDGRTEFRQYLTYNKNKVKQEKADSVNRDMPVWAAIAGKYFLALVIPLMNQYEVSFSSAKEEGLSDASRLFISRPPYGGSKIEDKYYIYLGPKKEDILNTYFNGQNKWYPAIYKYPLGDAAKTRSFMSIPPLESFLKWLLMIIQKAVRNYGVAIIIITILVKLALFPLTRKGSEATMRMQALAPRIKEIQEKYKNNKQKMNVEMAEFYKKEGYNPLSGCLPMIIQIPIFFAMYNLFNNHFDLRGAMFIPGWIPDLSLPESILDFPEGFKLPLLGWTALRLLPFLYVGSQLLYGKATQTPDQKNNSQMKIMLYAMPVVFFFILYDVPSGLLLYWIMSNVLTMVQQISINKYISKKKAAAAAEQKGPVIAPRKKK
ncbi:MAG: membrane protein insertase YidC [Treponema sp.]|jgi:YidC/Oxa1 family membrane protein insertase|nr:membrane protein insertase YidC [Treponema sp.]